MVIDSLAKKSNLMMQTNLRPFMFGNDSFQDIKSILEEDGLILYPTDTIWGIGCDATNERAVERVFQLKQRDPAKTFVLLVDSLEMLKDYVEQVPPKIETLLAFHTRPLTVVYDQAKKLAPNTVAADGSIAIRIASNLFCKQLIQAFGKPLVATSANISNEPFPKNFGAISSEVIKGVDYVVRLNQENITFGEPSVIIRYADGEVKFLRE